MDWIASFFGKTRFQSFFRFFKVFPKVGGNFMRMQLLPDLGIRQRIGHFLDLLIDALAELKDYFLFKHITLSEGFFFALAFLRAVWFTVFGSENANYDYFFSAWFWIAVFTALTIIHLTGFLTGWILARTAVMYAHGVIWLFMTFLALISRTTAPAVPTFLLYTFFSLIVIVRISRERTTLTG